MQEMKRVALLEFMGGSNLRLNQSSSIFKKILHLILNLHIFIQQTYLNKIGKPGCKWIIQWTKMEDLFYREIKKIKNSHE